MTDALARFRAGASAALEALDRGVLDEVDAHLEAREGMCEELSSRIQRFGVLLRAAGGAEAWEEASRAVAEEADRCMAAEGVLQTRARGLRNELASNLPHARPRRDGYGVEMGGGWVDRRV